MGPLSTSVLSGLTIFNSFKVSDTEMSSEPRTARKSVMIRVIVRDDTNPDAKPIHDRTGDHSDRYFREWIADTTWWAMRNGKSIVQYPNEDYSVRA